MGEVIIICRIIFLVAVISAIPMPILIWRTHLPTMAAGSALFTGQGTWRLMMNWERAVSPSTSPARVSSGSEVP